MPQAIGTNKLPGRQINGSSDMRVQRLWLMPTAFALVFLIGVMGVGIQRQFAQGGKATDSQPRAALIAKDQIMETAKKSGPHNKTPAKPKESEDSCYGR